MKHALLIGIAFWLVGTVSMHLAGARILHAGDVWRAVALYLVSFVSMALLVPRIFRRLGLARASWPAAATLLMLPTLIFDALSSAFFSAAFPNIDPAAAGVFGGWMLICCGGAVAGAWLRR